MKKTLLIFLMAVFSLHAQETTTDTTSVSEDATDGSHVQDVYRILKDTNNNSRSNKIGVFVMQKGKINVYIEKGRNSELKGTAVLKEISFDIVDGFIKDIVAVTEDGQRYTNSVSISLIRYNSRYQDRLYNIDPSLRDNFIELGHALKYYCEIGNNYSPDNVQIKLPEVKKVQVKSRNLIIYDGNGRQTIKKEDLSNDDVYTDELEYEKAITLDDGISNLIDYRIYSDFLGLIESTTNGIVNFEARANLPLNVSNMHNTNFYIFKTIKPFVRYSRFDKEDRVIETDSVFNGISNDYTVKNTMQLIQKSYLSCGFSIDVLTWNPKNSFVEFNIPFQNYFYLGEAISGIKENITSVSYGTGLEMKVNRSKSFGIDSGFYVNRLRHLYNRSYQVEEINSFNYFSVDSEVSFYGKDKGDALFLRFNYTSVFGDSNNFFQFQIGYKSGLNF